MRIDQQWLKTANWKQQNTENVLLLVENCDIKLEILHKHNPFDRIRDPDNCDVRVIFLWRFLTWPRNYYNNNKQWKSSLTQYKLHCLHILFLYINNFFLPHFENRHRVPSSQEENEEREENQGENAEKKEEAWWNISLGSWPWPSIRIWWENAHFGKIWVNVNVNVCGL